MLSRASSLVDDRRFTRRASGAATVELPLKGNIDMSEPRRCPAPWGADKAWGRYIVRDANGQALAYLYSRDNEVEVRQARMLTKNEAVADNLGEQGFRHQLCSH
jgi:hypothetical protein